MTVRCGSWTWLLALALLQTATALPWHGDAGRWLTSLAQPSPDLVCLLVAVLAGTAAGWPRSSAWTAGLLLWIAALLRPFVELFPQVFQRPFELADLLQIPGLLHLLMANAPLWQQVVVVVAVVAIWPLLALAFVRVARMARSPRVDRRVLFGSQAAVLLGLLLAPLVWQSSILLAVVTHTYLATKLWLDADRIEDGIRADIDAGIGRMVAAPLELGGLRGIDVHVLVVESYGAMAWRERPLRPRVEALWQELAGPLRDHGFAGVSGRTHPSITGGGSWLAHQELFTSVAVPDQRTFDRVLQSRAQALPWVFRKAGWHTVEMMPAMPRHWREGDAFYGFTEGLVQPDLEYSGHAYGFGKVPDQVALQQLLERVVAPAQQPLFVVFVSTSSHSPWSETPPFLADWQLNPAALARPAIVHPVSWADVPSGSALVPAYLDSLDYALRAAIGYVCRLPRPSLVLLLGDHQPPLAVGDDPDRSREVPVHVLSNRPELLQAWREMGFADGHEPLEAGASLPMYDLAPRLLRAYSR